jgi:hypothetical protein
MDLQKKIRKLLNKFSRTGSVHDEESPGRPSTPQQNVELVRETFEEDSRASVRITSQRLAIPRSSVHTSLKSKLKKKCFHIQVLHDLHEEDYPRRPAMCVQT